MSDRQTPDLNSYGMNLSDIAAEADQAELELEYEEHEILADDPTD